MRIFLYKWLPIVFGCHCRKERSFHYHGKQFPICARCSGEFVGILIGLCGYAVYEIQIYVAICFMIPMEIDGFVQLWTSYESKNWRRFITGFLFGYALSSLFLMSTIYVYDSGSLFAKKYLNK